MTWGQNPVDREARVTLIRKIKVPAGSAVLCPVCLDVGLGDFMVVPGVHLLSDTLLMLHTYHASGDSTAVCLINASDKDVVLAAESAVGRAVEADLHLHVRVPFLSRTVCTLAEAAPPQEVTVHLQDLLERYSEELTEEQRPQLEFQDVYARPRGVISSLKGKRVWGGVRYGSTRTQLYWERWFSGPR